LEWAHSQDLPDQQDQRVHREYREKRGMMEM
jgi:hypothetical protein